jgi:hypothetical protein
MAKRLLVEGLDWGVSEGQLMRIFAPFGELDEARVAIDWETGRSRGFGYVTFRDSGDAEAAITGLDGQKLAGKTLRVMVAPEQGQAPRPPYRGGDYGHVEPSPEKDGKPAFRSADFDGGGRRAAAEDPRTDRKLYRSADFGYVEREATSADPVAAAEAAPGGAPAATPSAPVAPAKGPRRPAPDPEDALDEEEKAARAKYGGWKEASDNDGGVGGGGNPFG